MTVKTLGVATAGTAGLTVLLWWLFRPETEDEREAASTKFLTIPEGKELLEPSFEWQPVEDHHVCPPGLEYRLDLSSGKNLARIPPPT